MTDVGVNNIVSNMTNDTFKGGILLITAISGQTGPVGPESIVHSGVMDPFGSFWILFTFSTNLEMLAAAVSSSSTSTQQQAHAALPPAAGPQCCKSTTDCAASVVQSVA